MTEVTSHPQCCHLPERCSDLYHFSVSLGDTDIHTITAEAQGSSASGRWEGLRSTHLISPHICRAVEEIVIGSRNALLVAKTDDMSVFESSSMDLNAHSVEPKETNC